jgi:hypothetical protein
MGFPFFTLLIFFSFGCCLIHHLVYNVLHWINGVQNNVLWYEGLVMADIIFQIDKCSERHLDGQWFIMKGTKTAFKKNQIPFERYVHHVQRARNIKHPLSFIIVKAQVFE